MCVGNVILKPQFIISIRLSVSTPFEQFRNDYLGMSSIRSDNFNLAAISIIYPD